MNSTFVGTCMTMCPEEECKRTPNRWFEIDPRTKEPSPEFYIKQYHRSDAGKSVLPKEVRPLKVLQKTMDHCLNVVIGKLVGYTEGATEYNMALFLRDKFRAIQMDINQQNLRNPETIDILEKIALFFIACSIRFLDEDDFNPTQNFERITNTLLTLDELYEDYFHSTGKHMPNESEFRSAHLLVSITDKRFMYKMMRLPNYVLESSAMKIVFELRNAYNLRNIQKYVEIANKAPFHIMCIAIASAKELWGKSLQYYWSAFHKNSIRPDFFKLALSMGNKDFSNWRKDMNIEEKGNYFVFTSDSPDIKSYTKPVVPPKIKMAIGGTNFIDFFNVKSSGAQRELNKPKEVALLPPKPKQEEIPSEHNSRSETESETETDRSYSSSQSSSAEEEEHSEEKQEIEKEEKPPAYPKQEEKHEEEEKRIEAKREASKVVTAQAILSGQEGERSITLPPVLGPPLKAKRTEIIPASLNIEALIPRGLPSRCFATIGVNAGDCSLSANFAIKRFRTALPIIYCDEIHTKDCIIYLLIVRNDMMIPESPLGALIHCEEYAPPVGEENALEFNINNTSSPYFTFDSILRKAIKMSAREITPFDITEMFINAAFPYVDSFKFDAYKKAFVKTITSPVFLNYLVPFNHRLISMNDINHFCDSVQLANLNKDMYGVKQFLVPLDKSFKIEDFVSKVTSIVGELNITESCEISTTFDDLIAEFCEGL